MWHTDRLARRTRGLLGYLEVSKLAGVVTLTVKGNGMDPSSSDSKFPAPALDADHLDDTRRLSKLIGLRADAGNELFWSWSTV